tara:strand:+ start:8845 stop:9510 length:666 start_codon:yes stop_codon:yes gene_type:complete
MSGDYKLKELLYQATLNKSFERKIHKLKTKYSVPDNGYDKAVDFPVYREMVADCYELQAEYGIPLSDPTVVLKYVLHGIEDWDKYESYTEPFYIIDHPKKLRNDIEDLYQKTKQPYVKLLIPSYANQTEVKEHLAKMWPDIQERLGTKGQKIKQHKNKNRDQTIRQLMKATKEQLADKYDEQVIKGRTKEIMVASILKQHYGFRASPETIKKVTHNKSHKE